LRYDERVNSKTKTPDERTGISPFDRFTKAMDGLMSVPHSEIKAKLDAEKKAKQRKKQPTTKQDDKPSQALR